MTATAVLPEAPVKFSDPVHFLRARFRKVGCDVQVKFLFGRSYRVNIYKSETRGDCVVPDVKLQASHFVEVTPNGEGFSCLQR